ncbi:PilT protein domain protein [uncultured Desulfobacterium sp.]|uniref:PilT protein domain protein n=1 Tax=uncultured Desulfobacterium sp. TaxID=201089 RepID=A0A445N2L9_9BACT|nr:PilT protein domain protein [uncultured Desulfobacterium sp.]
MKQRFLFDSHALLAFFQKEDGAEVVAEILRKAISHNQDRLICIINLGEILYLTKRRFGDEKKLQVLAKIHQLGIQILSVPDSIVFQAAGIKATYPISYSDCFALSCAISESAILVTGDPEFKQVSHMAEILWFR